MPVVTPLATALREGRATSAVPSQLDVLLRWLTGSKDAETVALAAELAGHDPAALRRRALRLLDAFLFTGRDGGVEVLGLEPGASRARLRTRYRLLMRIYHPDRAEGDPAWYQERAARLNRAYARACAAVAPEVAWGAAPAQTPSERRPASWLRRGRAWSLALPSPRVSAVTALVVATPLALGGVLDGARAALIACVALLVAAEWAPRALRGDRLTPHERPWLAVWLTMLVLLGVQLAPLPGAWAQALGAQPDWLWATGAVRSAISPFPAETLAYGATFSAYWAVAWWVSRLGRREVSVLAGGITGLAAFEALYGLYAIAHGSDSILGLWPREHYRGDATGTFVNRNHFAGLLAAAWPLALAVLLPRGRLGVTRPRLALAILLCVAFGAALMASHSRLGLGCAGVGLVVWLALQRRKHGRRTHRALLLGAGLPLAALIGGLWFGPVETWERFCELPTGDRAAVWRATFELPPGSWWLGAGAGAFGDVFKTVQPMSLRPSYHHAHSDWLELVLELGVVGVLALGVAGRHWWRQVRPRRLERLQRGALAGALAVLLHGAGDFGLRVPGTALVFWSLVGIVANAELGGRRPGSSR